MENSVISGGTAKNESGPSQKPEGDQRHQRRKFPTDGGKQSGELLGLVHSDLCGKMNAKSLSGGEYFLTFIDDKSRYVWVYTLKHKDDVFSCFLEWKALLERSTNQKH